MIYIEGLHVQVSLQNCARCYTLMYKLKHENVHKEIPFQKTVQFGIQNRSKWMRYTYGAYVYKLTYKIVLKIVQFGTQKCKK